MGPTVLASGVTVSSAAYWSPMKGKGGSRLLLSHLVVTFRVSMCWFWVGVLSPVRLMILCVLVILLLLFMLIMVRLCLLISRRSSWVFLMSVLLLWIGLRI